MHCPRVRMTLIPALAPRAISANSVAQSMSVTAPKIFSDASKHGARSSVNVRWVVDDGCAGYINGILIIIGLLSQD